MYKYHCLNPISDAGISRFSEDYQETALEDSDVILVRSANMHEMQLPDNIKAIARAGAGVNNIPLDVCTKKGGRSIQYPGCQCQWCKGDGNCRNASGIP